MSPVVSPANARLTQADSENRLRSAFVDDVAGKRTRELVVEAAVAREEERLGEHGVAHRRERVRERGLGMRSAREVHEAGGDSNERQSVGRRAAAVRRRDERIRLELTHALERVTDAGLHHAVNREVVGDGRAELPRNGEKARVFAGAVVAQRIAILAVLRVRAAQAHLERQVRAAFQCFGGDACALEQARDGGDVGIAAVVRSASHGEFARGHAERVEGAGRDERQGLERLCRRAQNDRSVGFTAAPNEAARRVDDGDGRRVNGFELRSAKDVDGGGADGGGTRHREKCSRPPAGEGLTDGPRVRAHSMRRRRA